MPADASAERIIRLPGLRRRRISISGSLETAVAIAVSMSRTQILHPTRIRGQVDFRRSLASATVEIATREHLIRSAQARASTVFGAWVTRTGR